MVKILFLIIFISHFGFTGQVEKKEKLKIKIDNIKEEKGNLMIAVYRVSDQFLGEVNFAGKAEKVASIPYQEVFIYLPFGKYAVAIYHDVNSDGELNTNFIGIPKEPYGFSNNSMGMFGPPSFEEASFSFENAEQLIEINL